MLGPEPPRDVLHQAAVRSDRRPMHDSFMARQAALLVNTWELALIERPDGQALTPDKPARYTLRLVEDGVVAIRAGDAWGVGAFTLAGQSLTFDRIVFAEGLPSESFAQVFVEALRAARTYVTRPGDLWVSAHPPFRILKFTAIQPHRW